LFPRSLDDPDRLRPVWLALDRAETDADQRQRLQGGPLDRTATAELLRHHLRELTKSVRKKRGRDP